MNWLRSRDRFLEAEETYVETLELQSDCLIPGIADYGEGFILCGSIAEIKQDANLQPYQMKIKRSTSTPDTMEAGKKGIDLDTHKELVSLMSLHLHARFYLSSKTTNSLTHHGIPSRINYRMAHWPYRFDDTSHIPELFDKKGNLTTLPSFLDKIERLPSKFHRDFIYATFNYADGIRWIGVDDAIAYLKLVIAIEILAGDKLVIEDDLNNLLNEAKEKLDEELVIEVRNIQKQRRVKKGFVQFVMNHKTDFLLGKREGRAYVTNENIHTYLKTIYDSRSDYVHEGRPMAISELTHYNWDVNPRGDKISGTLMSGEREKVPTVLFFESLVRHCLLEYLNRKLEAA